MKFILSIIIYFVYLVPFACISYPISNLIFDPELYKTSNDIIFVLLTLAFSDIFFAFFIKHKLPKV